MTSGGWKTFPPRGSSSRRSTARSSSCTRAIGTCSQTAASPITTSKPRHNSGSASSPSCRASTENRGMTSAPIILVPGFWLGAWAWDDVVSSLRQGGNDVTALTLPGLESADADRSTIRLSDHVDAICEAVTAAGRPVVLAAHSGAGVAGYATSDRNPDQIAAMVYVDSGPGTGASEPDFAGVEKPMNWDDIETGKTLEGLSEEQLETF